MKILSEQTNKVDKIIVGLKGKINLVKEKGIDDKFIAEMEVSNKFIKANNEALEKLKTESKIKAREANLRLIELKVQIQKVKKIVKQNFYQSRWKEFGITDKR
ncbi:hypothetical protein CYCD_22130 [Tenuifilaceae bacterium CYCD]|nr:hypothetical protein CYCD_22130 [Tenuifilaceae bacterium CYCD]